MARPTKYKAIYCKKILDYFKIPNQIMVFNEEYNPKSGKLVSKKPVKVFEGFYEWEYEYSESGSVIKKRVTAFPVDFPTIEGFAESIQVHKTTLLAWCEKYEEFSYAYARAKQIQEAIWAQKSLTGEYNAAFAIMAGKNWFGYKDKSTVTYDGISSKNNNLLDIINESTKEDIDTNDIPEIQQTAKSNADLVE